MREVGQGGEKLKTKGENKTTHSCRASKLGGSEALEARATRRLERSASDAFATQQPTKQRSSRGAGVGGQGAWGEAAK